MGTITNNAATGDPIGDVHVYGFESKDDAIQFAGSSLPLKPGNTQFQRELTTGQHVSFSGNPWVAFWHVNDATDSVLLMLAQCYGDLQLSIQSLGAQMLLYREA